MNAEIEEMEEKMKEKVGVLEKANEIHKSGDPYKIGLLDGFLMGLTGRNAEQEIGGKKATPERT